MRPTPLAARKAGAALAVLMLSTALAACQPDGSTDAATPTSAPTATDQTSAPTNGSTTSPTNGSTTNGSTTDGSSTDAAATTSAPTSADQTSTPTNGSTSNPTGSSQGDAPRGLESFYNQTISWQDCSNETTTFQCGTVTVPLDYEHPDGQTITIAVKKLPALDGDAEHGSLFLNPGGPGGSGIEVVEFRASMFEGLRGSYDIIGFDPRGVGRSTPITCWTDDEINQYLANPNDDATNPTDPLKGVKSKNVAAQDKIDRGAVNAARCAKHSEVPELLDHVGTRDVARDLDVLRATNGNARLNYLGMSYGTYIGALYADLFPDRVGRTVLDSAMDPAQRWADGDAEITAFTEGVLRQYVEHCRAQDGCPLSGSTDEAVSQLAAFVDGLDKNPLTTPDSDATISTREATAIIQQYAVEKPDWDGLTAMLTPAMTNHDGTLMVKAMQGSPGLPPEMTAEVAARLANARALSNAVICNDYPDTGATASDWDAQAAAERKAHPFFGGISNSLEAYCRGWGHRGKTPPQEARAEGSAPILVVGIKGDIKTLYSWSQTLAGQLDNNRLLTVEGYGHVAFNVNTCAITAITGFLVNGTMPDEGTTCAADPQPAASEPQLVVGGAED
ncbi:alpha/beta fold hydrolase [uncultured Actinomyces sp.]|uniref:alpha/beta fold hydrolase n=1 Tax=uncultured Actinomyces sp. TaxID=249061 RepID=UPI0028D0EEB0|nr:alpha/beta fold hydrolase [uncultured Actinomyces sp.]